MRPSTRQRFELIAEVLREQQPCEPNDNNTAYDQWLSTVDAFADALYATKGRFDRGRFLRVCDAE